MYMYMYVHALVEMCLVSGCRLLVDKLKALGVPPGPLYSQLKRGESIVTASGEEVCSSDVVGPQRPGRKLVVLGDTADSSDIVELARDADVVVHEATNENAHEEKAIARGHSSPGKAATDASSVQSSVVEPLKWTTSKIPPPN